MLGTCEQLAAGMKRATGELKKWGGAEAEVEAAAMENAPLRLWVGEQ